jgi:hypothetical protein
MSDGERKFFFEKNFQSILFGLLVDNCAMVVSLSALQNNFHRAQTR